MRHRDHHTASDKTNLQNVELLFDNEDVPQELGALHVLVPQQPLKKVIIRMANRSDLTLLQAFMLKHGNHTWNDLSTKEVKAHLADLANHTAYGYVATIDDQYIGGAFFYLNLPAAYQKYETGNNQAAYLSDIVVHQDCLGQGVARHLIAAIKKYLRSRHISSLYTSYHIDNVNAAKALQRAGFQLVDKFGNHFVVCKK